MSVVAEASSIAGLINLAGQSVEACSALYTFIRTYRNIGQKLADIADEVSQLQQTLNQIGSILALASASPGITPYCIRLQEHLTVCRLRIQEWHDQLRPSRQGSSATVRASQTLKLTADKGYLKSLQAQIVRARDELQLELSIFQSASSSLTFMVTQATLFELRTLQGHQERSMSALLHGDIGNQDYTGRKLLQVTDLSGVERRLDSLSLALRTITNSSKISVSNVGESLHPRPYLEGVGTGQDQLLLNDEQSPSPVGHVSKSTQHLRLIRPALLVYEQKGHVKRSIVPLLLPGVDLLCPDQREALIRQLLNLRLLLWLLQRATTQISGFPRKIDRSLLVREARVTLAWDYWFSWIGLAHGLMFSMDHLLVLLTGFFPNGHQNNSGKRTRRRLLKQLESALQANMELDEVEDVISHDVNVLKDREQVLARRIEETEKRIADIDDQRDALIAAAPANMDDYQAVLMEQLRKGRDAFLAQHLVLSLHKWNISSERLLIENLVLEAIMRDLKHKYNI